MVSSSFEVIAKALKDCKPSEDTNKIAYEQWLRDCNKIGNAMCGLNLGLNLRSFFIACGIET